MIINRVITPYVRQLDKIYSDNRRKYASHQSYMLYQIIVEFMRYWRHLQATVFDQLPDEAQDEIYYCITEKLYHVFDAHMDIYWMINDVDGQPLYPDGREPADFWRRKLEDPNLQLRRMEHI